MKTKKKLSKALEEFRTNYPSVTSSDLQTFVIGYKQALKDLEGKR